MIVCHSSEMRRLPLLPPSCRLRLLSPGSTACLLLSTLIVAGCGRATEERATERRLPLVEAVESRLGTLPLEETVNGVVRAGNQVAIRPEIAAPIVEVAVRSGEAVEAGQVLVRLQDGELRERLRQAEADVRLAEAAATEAEARAAEVEARLRRTLALAEQELVSEQELETQQAQLAALRASAAQAVARVEQAMATADERRSALTKTLVRSPVAGRVGQRQAEVGMRVDPGSVLFLVGSLDEVMVEVPLTQQMLDHLDTGMPVRIEHQATSREPIAAELSRISPFLAEESFTTVGEIDVENRDGRLRPGMFVTVRILYGESERATLIPTSAVWEDPESGDRGVFVVEDATGLASPNAAGREASDVSRSVVFRPISALAEGGSTVGVEGVEAGEWVVILGQHLLRQAARDEQLRGDEQSAGGAVNTRARVRPTSWEVVQGLQSLQREDLLAEFLDKQQRIAAVLGAEIPDSEEVVDRILQQDHADAESVGID